MCVVWIRCHCHMTSGISCVSFPFTISLMWLHKASIGCALQNLTGKSRLSRYFWLLLYIVDSVQFNNCEKFIRNKMSYKLKTRSNLYQIKTTLTNIRTQCLMSYYSGAFVWKSNSNILTKSNISSLFLPVLQNQSSSETKERWLQALQW